MTKLMIIGAGGVGRVVAHKCASVKDVFLEIVLASRTLAKCEQIASEIKQKIKVAQVDANNVSELVALFKTHQTELVINVALPYQDLTIMDACLEAGVHYIDTANYEPRDNPRFEYKWQWAYQDKFRDKSLMALLGSGFDPGVTNVFCAHAQKHHFDEIHKVDIYDCNAGDHGHPFATNFNPEINIREITQKGRYWEKGEWKEIEPLSHKEVWNYPEIGNRDSYLLYHEELESLVKNIPNLQRIRFFMTFGEAYLRHLNVLQNIGMTSVEPVKYKGIDVVPVEFLKSLLPDPASLAQNYTGKTCIGNVIEGIKNNEKKRLYIYNVSEHQKCYEEVLSQAVSYTTGVPAMIGAMLVAKGIWKKSGVFNIEEMDPDPFMEALNNFGLPWVETYL